MGGGSASLTPFRHRTLLQAITDRLGPGTATDAEVVYETGVRIDRLTPVVRKSQLVNPAGEPGLTVSYVNGSDWTADVVLEQPTPTTLVRFFGSVPEGVDPRKFSAHIEGSFVPDVDGPHTIGVVTTGPMARLHRHGQRTRGGARRSGHVAAAQRGVLRLRQHRGHPRHRVPCRPPSSSGHRLRDGVGERVRGDPRRDPPAGAGRPDGSSRRRCRRRRSRGRDGRHQRRVGDRGPRPHDDGSARPPGRIGPSRRCRESEHGSDRERRIAGDDGLGRSRRSGLGTGRPHVVLRRPGTGRGARRRAPRRRRPGRPTADDHPETPDRPPGPSLPRTRPRQHRSRYPALRRRAVHGLPRVPGSRTRASFRVRPRPQLRRRRLGRTVGLGDDDLRRRLRSA